MVNKGVTFSYGVAKRVLPQAVNQPISKIVPAVRKVMGVQAGALTLVNENRVTEAYVFKDGDNVTFYKESGDKGC